MHDEHESVDNPFQHGRSDPLVDGPLGELQSTLEIADKTLGWEEGRDPLRTEALATVQYLRRSSTT